jgi:branched-chain amino acid transport system substrate-binding protein
VKKKLLLGLIALTLVALVALPLFAACAPGKPAKDKIVIGGARSLTGPHSIYEETAFGPIYKMWVEEVNADGGLYIEEYGKKLPITYEGYIYDDTSDLGTMIRLVEKLIVEDKVDFVLPPNSTAFLFAAAPIFNKHGYILLGAEGGATTIEEQLPSLPYFFGVLNYSDRYQLPVFADLCVELGVEKVGMIWLQDLHGIEYSGVAGVEFEKAGIEVAMSKSVPMDVTDVSLLLLEAQDKGVDALCVFAYPDQCFLTVGTAQAMGINFNAVLLGPGGCFGVFPTIFGDAVEGVMFEGAWNCESTPGAAEFCDKFIAAYGIGTVDWWGHLHYQGAIEFFEQAIVEAGTLDQSVIREVMATSTFDTVLGPTWFDQFGDGGCLLAIESQPGEIGQWQNGYPEVIDPPNEYGEKRTAEPWYPKPDWPAAE